MHSCLQLRAGNGGANPAYGNPDKRPVFWPQHYWPWEQGGNSIDYVWFPGLYWGTIVGLKLEAFWVFFLADIGV